MSITDVGVGEDFFRQTDPYRRELLAHCYRMLGSVHDAEDLVQETYLRAWRSYGKFEGRSSLRTWLHRIATNVCLTALESRGRRPLPAGLGTASDPAEALTSRHEVPWLEPVPDSRVGADTGDPAAVVTSRESIRLAFVAALQHLPARQRAVLILREVLKLRAAEVAEVLDTTTPAVNSALQRARAQLAETAPAEDTVVESVTPRQRALLDRYVAAFETKDVPAIVALLTADVVWEMPPFANWYRGPRAVAHHLDVRCPGGPDDFRLVPVAANGQPGYGMYLRDAAGDFQPFTLQVLTMGAAGLTHVASFFDLRLFATFALPATLPADTPPLAV